MYGYRSNHRTHPCGRYVTVSTTGDKIKLGRCAPLKRPSRPPKPRAHLRMPACHCLTRPFDELEKGSLLHGADNTLSTIGSPDTHTRGTGKKMMMKIIRTSRETAERPYKKRMECDQAKMISPLEGGVGDS
jgi:hypothetical protein